MKEYSFIYCGCCGFGHQGKRRSAKRKCKDIRCERYGFQLSEVGSMRLADDIRAKWRAAQREKREREYRAELNAGEGSAGG